MATNREFRWHIASFGVCLLVCLGGCPQSKRAEAIAAAGTAAADRVAVAGLPSEERSRHDARPDARDLFPGRTEVTVAELLEALADEVSLIAESPAVRSEYAALLKKYRLQDREGLYEDFVRVRTAFEATRAGGLWGIKWRVTDQLPQSDRIWTQWRSFTITRPDAVSHTTAVAECDELSALFAFVAHGIGLSSQSEVGLLWPTSNHTVAVWAIDGPPQTRIVLPTSQVFLDGAQSLDTGAFDPWKQKRIFDYTRDDAMPGARVPAVLARYFLDQVRRYGGVSRDALQTMRNRREYDQRRGTAGA